MNLEMQTDKKASELTSAAVHPAGSVSSEDPAMEFRVLISDLEKRLASAVSENDSVTSDMQIAELKLERARKEIVDLNAKMTDALASLRSQFPKPGDLAIHEKRTRDAFRSLHRSVRLELKRVGRRVAMSGLAGRGNDEGVAPTLFASAWIAEQNPDIGQITLETYLRNPRYWNIPPHPLFSPTFYSEDLCWIDGHGVSPLEHYVRKGWREGLNPHPWFFNDWYLLRHPDVLAEGRISPLEHYVDRGWAEGRWPNPVFDPTAYLERHPDVRSAGLEPLFHYMAFGSAEGREVPGVNVGETVRRWMPDDLSHLHPFDFMFNFDVPDDMPAFDVEPLLSGLVPIDPSVLAHAGTNEAWPPEPLNEYWPPQTLRDFVLERYSDAVLKRIWYLYSVMAAFEGDPTSFPQSDACRRLVSHARGRAADMQACTRVIPDVSIVIPVYNNILDTLLCIVSILDAEGDATFEIIVADDGSKDATTQIIPLIGGCVRHVRHARNHGFLGNCNAAAAHARGKYILLLNNDTLVMPHWLDALLDPFTRFERVGLTGAKLINWNGTLQEAGGIYWRDGSAWNFGRDQVARAPQFSYLKDVDYISGAAICLPSEIWLEMDGFDPLFSPAYCEDSDLAFRLRAAGYRTLLTPDAEVIHHEGRSHGRDVSSGIKAYQVTNMQRLLSRWRDVLERDHYPNAENVFRARDRSFDKRHVLVVDHYVPQWNQDAGSRSTYNCIEAFIELGYSVTLWPDNLWRDPDYVPVYQSMGVEVIYGNEFVNNFPAFVAERADLYDVAFINRPHIAESYIDALRDHSKAKIMFYGHDLHFLRMERALAIGEPIKRSEIEAARALELRICEKSDVVIYPDPAEVETISKMIGSDREYVTLPVVVYATDILAKAKASLTSKTESPVPTLLFVGGFNHAPNRDGIIWFVKEVLPIVQSVIPSLRLVIAGSKPPPNVHALANDDIIVTGFVTDAVLGQFYAEASLAIAPLRYGAGVKGKVIEALSKGVPLVTTPVGAQGLSNPEEFMFMGSTTEDFAEAVIFALTNRDEAYIRANAGIDYVSENFCVDVLKSIFSRLVEGRPMSKLVVKL